MSKKPPVTPAIRVLRERNVPFEVHLYTYEERGGTRVSSRELGVEEHAVIKTLVMEDDQRQPLVVLQHGDREVSTRGLARLIHARSVQPCDPTTAQRHSGYQVGGTSPFGLKRDLPVYAQTSIQDLPLLYINGGKRGLLVSITPADLQRVLQPTWLDVATPE